MDLLQQRKDPNMARVPQIVTIPVPPKNNETPEYANVYEQSRVIGLRAHQHSLSLLNGHDDATFLKQAQEDLAGNQIPMSVERIYGRLKTAEAAIIYATARGFGDEAKKFLATVKLDPDRPVWYRFVETSPVLIDS